MWGKSDRGKKAHIQWIENQIGKKYTQSVDIKSDRKNNTHTP